LSELVQIMRQLWRHGVAVLMVLAAMAWGLASWLTSTVRDEVADGAGISADQVEFDGTQIELVGFSSQAELDQAMDAVRQLDLGWEVSGGVNVGSTPISAPTDTKEDPESVAAPATQPTVGPESTTTSQAAGESESTTTTEAKSTTTATEVVESLNALFELEPINFDYLSVRLAEESKATLDHAAGVINANPDAGRLKVVGHTDSLGPSAANQRLSERRALIVVEYLIAYGNVDADRLEYEGRGETELKVDPQVTYWDGLANRRIEWEILS